MFKLTRKKNKHSLTIQEIAYLDEFLRTEIKFAQDTIDKYKGDGHSYSKLYVHDATIRKSSFEKVLRNLHKI